MSRTNKLLSAAVLFALLSFVLATPAYAFDGRGGDKVTIQTDQVVNDDLYVTANEFVLDGTVNGDVVAFAQGVTINGTITGDLITGAQTVVVNGTVKGSVRMAGSTLFVGEKANIGEDIVAAGSSLELRKGSAAGRDVVFATGQTLLGANIGRNVIALTGGLEIDGNVGGDVKAQVGEADSSRAGPPPGMFMGPSTVPIPLVRSGISIDPAARIAGNLEYTQTKDLVFPAGVVAGKITRLAQPEERQAPRPEHTAGQKVLTWMFQSLRSLVTLLLVGLLLLWLFPLFTASVSDELRTKPWPSLLWGVITYVGFFFAILLIVFVTVLGALAFGVVTLGGLSGTVVGLGLLSLMALIAAFALATAFVAKVAFGMSIGKWILGRLGSPLAEHRYWPMVIGVALTVVVAALFSFPLIPGLLGFLLDLTIVFFGLGALWLWGRERFARKSAAVNPQA